eukprot:1332097-Amorphochlora_amoeboformis.AAC.2
MASSMLASSVVVLFSSMVSRRLEGPCCSEKFRVCREGENGSLEGKFAGNRGGPRGCGNRFTARRLDSEEFVERIEKWNFSHNWKAFVSFPICTAIFRFSQPRILQ